MQAIDTTAKALVFGPDGKVLLLRRSHTVKTRPREIDLPGGKQDEGETVEAAVLRELQEEIGLTLDPAAAVLVWTETVEYQGVVGICLLFVVKLEVTPAITLSDEHSESMWCTLNKADSQLTHPVWQRGLRFVVEHNLLK